MNQVSIFFALIALILRIAQAKNWALLIAGSNSWTNYRHQADVSHAYQILKNNGGFPAENIVTMMYDDIANSPSNPKKGQIFNRPDGPNVYEGVNIDYKGKDVTTENFLNVLTGRKNLMENIGSGKVIDSTADDNIFVYYADHGAFGFVGMPSGKYLYAHQLNNTFKYMIMQKKFKNLVFYMEACESGSMFEHLSTNDRIWAITAANAHQSSYAYYYDTDIGTYLGDEFSIRWLEDSESEQLNATFNLEAQYEIVKNGVRNSEVMKFGESDMASLPVGEFLLFEKFNAHFNNAKKPRVINDLGESADVREVEVKLLEKKIAHSTDPLEIADLKVLLNEELLARSKTDKLFANIISIVTRGKASSVAHPFGSPQDYICLKSSVESFEKWCGSLQGYGFKYGRVISALCDLGYDFSSIESAIVKTCPKIIA